MYVLYTRTGSVLIMGDIEQAIAQQNDLVNAIKPNLASLAERIKRMNQAQVGTSAEINTTIEGINGKLGAIKALIVSAKAVDGDLVESKKQFEALGQERERVEAELVRAKNDAMEANEKMLNRLKEQQAASDAREQEYIQNQALSQEMTARIQELNATIARLEGEGVASVASVERLEEEKRLYLDEKARLEGMNNALQAEAVTNNNNNDDLTRKVETIKARYLELVAVLQEIDRDIGTTANDMEGLENTQREFVAAIKEHLSNLDKELGEIANMPVPSPVNAGPGVPGAAGPLGVPGAAGVPGAERRAAGGSPYSEENGVISWNGITVDQLNLPDRQLGPNTKRIREARSDINNAYEKVLHKAVPAELRSNSDKNTAKIFWMIHPSGISQHLGQRHPLFASPQAIEDGTVYDISSLRGGRRTRRRRQGGRVRATKNKHGGYIAVMKHHKSRSRGSKRTRSKSDKSSSSSSRRRRRSRGRQ